MNYVLIIGAKSDIALALAHEYAKHGYNLYLAARKHEDLSRDVQDIKICYKVGVKAYELDITSFATHPCFYDQLSPSPVGVISVVGYLGNQENAETEFSEAQRIIETNYTGCVSLLNIASNKMKQKENGFIIGISSVAGDRGRQSNYIYGSAKAAFTEYLSGLRNRLTKFGVNVLTVKPGFVNTKMTVGMNLPKLITAEPAEVAKDIFRAQQKNQNEIYTKWQWRFIMLIIKHIPEGIFKKMKL